MLRIGFIFALILAANPADAADRLEGGIVTWPAHMRPSRPPVSDAARNRKAARCKVTRSCPRPTRSAISRARAGPNPHALLIAQYAVYASIGNRDGMQIISDQLRKFCVTREEPADFADHAKLHTGSPRQPSRTVSQMDQAWKLSQ